MLEFFLIEKTLLKIKIKAFFTDDIFKAFVREII